MTWKSLANLIKKGEGYDPDFKEGFSSSLSKEMCTFTNGNGGYK